MSVIPTVSVTDPRSPVSLSKAAQTAAAGGLPGTLPAGAAPKQARTIAVTGGKGGVGKSNFAVALALCAARAGQRVVILDADFGLAKLHVLLGLTPHADLSGVLSGEVQLADTLLYGPEQIRILPGASGLTELANLRADQRQKILAGLSQISQEFDLLILDTGAGINENVLTFVTAADEAIVVTTPEPTALADAYSLIKVAYNQRNDLPFHLIVNNATSPAEADAAARRIQEVAQHFLQAPIAYAGTVPSDPSIGKAVRARQAFLLHSPDAPAAQAFPAIAAKILRLGAKPADAGPANSARSTRYPAAPRERTLVMPAPKNIPLTEAEAPTFVQRLATIFGLGRR